MPSKQVILNSDGTYSLPFWGGKFWTNKITGRVTESDINRTDHKRSAQDVIETTNYYGRSGYIGSLTNKYTKYVTHTFKSSAFSIEDAEGNKHRFFLPKHIGITRMRIGDSVTVIKSDKVKYEETDNYPSQIGYIINHTNNQGWINADSMGRLGNVLSAMLIPVVFIGIIVGTILLGAGSIYDSVTHSAGGISMFGLVVIFIPIIALALTYLCSALVRQAKASLLLPYFATLALSKTGKVSEAEIDANDNQGINFIPKNKWIAATLALFIGFLGTHKFYMGYYIQGLILLTSFVTGLVIAVVTHGQGGIITPLLLDIPILIGIIDAILYATKSQEKFTKTYLIGKRPWF